MPEYTANAIQTVEVGQNVLLTDTPVRCTRGFVIHREDAGIITLRGIVNNGSNFAHYKVTFGGNIAVPTGQTVGAISTALSINGEAVATSNAIVTPTAVDEYFNISRQVTVLVPKGCCYTVAIKNTSTIPINAQNMSINVERVG